MSASRKIISSGEMAALEMNSEYFGVSTLQLMENAGGAVAREVAKRVDDGNKVTVLVGTGGNGGDGMVTARHLACLNYDIDLVLVGRPTDIRREIVKRNWDAVKCMVDSVRISIADDSAHIPKIEGTVVIDAMLGTGAHGSLRSPILEAVRVVNATSCFKVAVDIPTGVETDTGNVACEAIKADLTVTFHQVKRGLLTARDYVGELVVADIGIPREVETYVGPGDVILTRKPRLPNTHKGDYGRLLVIGGSELFSGAPTLAAMAASRVGVDIVYIATPRKTAHDIASISPTVITIKLEGEHLSPKNCKGLKEWIEKSTAVVMGPGLGLHRETSLAVKTLIEIIEQAKIPLLLDADALKAFAEFKHRVECPLVLTPHSGEFQILVGKDLPERQEAKIKHVREVADELNATILLKGPVDIISNGDKVKINKIVHNPGMTVGGTGDVLAGIVGALLAQGFDPFKASVSGVFINGAAGDFAVHERGYHILPTDLIDWIPKVMEEPMSHLTVRRS